MAKSMIFRLSQKLNSKIKAGALDTLPLDHNPYVDWSGHLFVAKQTQYIILSNTKGALLVRHVRAGITNESLFLERALSTIREFMEDRRAPIRLPESSSPRPADSFSSPKRGTVPSPAR